MPDANDMDLVREFARENSEAAFTELVRRHVSLVYSVARRCTGNDPDAEDVTQAVFIILAQKAAGLRSGTLLTGWLYETTRFTAARLLRTNARRHAREQKAYMQSALNDADTAETWRQLEPHLEAAMSALPQRDRALLVLRFYENKSGVEAAAALGIGEFAARKRTTRAIEKLRKFLGVRGVTSTAAVLTAAISANSVQAAPVSLASAIPAAALAKGAAVAGSTLTLAQGAAKAMTWAKLKLACGVGAAILVTGSAITVAVAEKNNDSPKPDGAALLKGVIEARSKIKSGEMQFIVAQHDFKWHPQTNYSLLKVSFDGALRRFEQLQRESVYASSDPEAIKLTDAKRIELNGDRDEMARLGLIILMDAHYRTIYNGKTITTFDPRMGTHIRDSKGGDSHYIFDPRTFGLFVFIDYLDNIEDRSVYEHARAVELLGKETVEGTPCWHVQLQMPVLVDTVNHITNGWKWDFWIDVDHPARVIKCNDPNRGGTEISKYSDQDLNDPLPIETDRVEHFGGDPNPCTTRMFRSHTRYNVPIAPKAFTLAGLGMPVGTDVGDDRIHRRIGYWTGNGTNLSEDLPRNTPRRRDEPPVMQDNIESLERVKTDGSFVDTRKIVVRRVGVGTGLFVLIFAVSMIGRLVMKRQK